MTLPQLQTQEFGGAASARRVIFRLHFYAGLLIAPFVLVLALTGIVYLFNTEIDDALHPSWRFAAHAGPQLPPERMVDDAMAAFPGARATRIDLPTAPDRTAVVFLTPQQGEPFRVYVDPVSGEARGSFVYTHTLVGFADTAHGSLMLGDLGDAIVELAACWAILMIATGIYLWWPRDAGGVLGAFFPRFGKGRGLWRSLHGATGLWTSTLVLFLLLTGLPWSDNWGSNLNKMMGAVGLGYPASYRTHIDHPPTAPQSEEKLGETASGVPWTLESAPAPHSNEHMMHHMDQPIDVGQAASIFASRGLTTAYRLVYPRDAHDVFTAYTYPDQPEGQRTIHLDQYSGEVVNDVSFADYGAGAKAVEWGVQLHMGNYFGLPNQILMLAAALGAAMLALTGPIMWLHRRKSGLGAPAPFKGGRVAWGLLAALVGFGVIFPLLGLSALLVLGLERLVLSRIPATRDWLGLSSHAKATPQ
ncbi:MAG: PepSY domain-containing protein [Terricaulis sp.]